CKGKDLTKHYGDRKTCYQQTTLVKRTKLQLYSNEERWNKCAKSSWNEDQKLRYPLKSKAINYLMCDLTKANYEKVHSYKSSKEMWDSLTLACKGTS
ncbi:hypothetical protein CR513_37002, partial [Mucuna pruriens]